jgi:hypothetical protein
MNPSDNRDMMVRQAAGLVVVMVFVVVSRLKRKRPEPDPSLYDLKCDAKQHRQQTLQAIYNSTDSKCISMLRMKRAPFFPCATYLGLGDL